MGLVSFLFGFRVKQPREYLRVRTIRKGIYTRVAPLRAEISRSPEPVAFADLDRGTFRRIRNGKRWGDVFDCGWLHVTGEVPRWILHSGTDIAGQGCGAPIHAAHGGFVTYAGWNGTLGNYIQLNHEDGTSSGYGHIRPGGILVGYGQYVHAGQVIARVGTTGASTGCHLHFIIRVNGQLTNPVPFMRNKGILLG